MYKKDLNYYTFLLCLSLLSSYKQTKTKNRLVIVFVQEKYQQPTISGHITHNRRSVHHFNFTFIYYYCCFSVYLRFLVVFTLLYSHVWQKPVSLCFSANYLQICINSIKSYWETFEHNERVEIYDYFLFFRSVSYMNTLTRRRLLAWLL